MEDRSLSVAREVDVAMSAKRMDPSLVPIRSRITMVALARLCRDAGLRLLRCPGVEAGGVVNRRTNGGGGRPGGILGPLIARFAGSSLLVDIAEVQKPSFGTRRKMWNRAHLCFYDVFDILLRCLRHAMMCVSSAESRFLWLKTTC